MRFVRVSRFFIGAFLTDIFIYIVEQFVGFHNCEDWNNVGEFHFVVDLTNGWVVLQSNRHQ